MIRVIATITIACLTPALTSAADDAKDEMKKLEGSWKVASAEADGKPFEVKNLGMSQMVVRDGKLIFRNDAKELMSFTFTVDPTKKPKHMDWKKEGEPTPLPTIYALDGDELKLCFPLLPKKGGGEKVDVKRPDSFETKDKPIMVLMMKREKK